MTRWHTHEGCRHSSTKSHPIFPRQSAPPKFPELHHSRETTHPDLWAQINSNGPIVPSKLCKSQASLTKARAVCRSSKKDNEATVHPRHSLHRHLQSPHLPLQDAYYGDAPRERPPSRQANWRCLGTVRTKLTMNADRCLVHTIRLLRDKGDRPVSGMETISGMETLRHSKMDATRTPRHPYGLVRTAEK